MFHVLPKDVSRLISWPDSSATKILCDTKTPREAIPLKKFVQFYKEDKLNRERCCKVCFRKAVLFAAQS